MQSQEYLALPGMRQSLLKSILLGPDEFALKRDNPKSSTETQILGNAVHLLVLEPHKSNCIIRIPTYDGRTSQGKIFNALKNRKFEECKPIDIPFANQIERTFGHIFANPNDYILLDDEKYEAANRMAENVRNNTHIAELFSRCTQFEKIITFSYKGIVFKAQIDAHGNFCILDLKTTVVRNNIGDIKREIRNQDHDFQAAAYSIGLNLIEYYMIFVRNVPPYSAFPIELGYNNDVMRDGFTKFNVACDMYNDCLKNNPEFKANHALRVI